MSGTATNCAGNFEIPDWGIDHLVLADWRTSVLRRQPRDGEGRQANTVSIGYRSASGIDVSVCLERGAATAFPTALDDDVLLGLMYLAREQGFPDIVRFVPDRLARIICWPRNDRYYKRITSALDRYKKLSATFHHNWYSKTDRAIKLHVMTGIVAQAEVVTRRGRRASNAIPESHVQWTENFNASLREGNVLPINFRLYFGWSRPGAKQLYRQLNKTWHGGAKPFAYERDLRELACGHLGMTDSQYLKRNFQLIVKEMEDKGYLTPMTEKVRYRRISAGIWRVRLELHPDHSTRSRKAATAPSPVEIKSEPKILVASYHQARFGRADYQPRPRELDHARDLIAEFGFETVSKATTQVTQLVRAQTANDLYFGFAAPYYRRALDRKVAPYGFRNNLGTSRTAVFAEQDRAEQRLRERRELRSKTLLAWNNASADERALYRQSALARAESETARRRILRAECGEPIPEFLYELSLSIGTGESPEHVH